MNHTHVRRLILHISMYLYISNRKNWIHAHRRGFWVNIALITYSFFLSPHLSRSFHSTTTPQAFNEWKKISFGLYMRLCVYIMPAFIQHNFFYFIFLEHFSVFYLLHSSVQLVRSYTRARGEISRLLRNLLKLFVSRLVTLPFYFFY